MNIWIVIILILVIIALIVTIRVVYELKTLKLVNYKIISDKLLSNEHKRIVFISDLHSRNYGDNNEKLIKLIKNQYPDYIFIGGDMVVASKGKDDDEVIKLLDDLSKITAVYFALGNHEKRLEIASKKYPNRFNKLKEIMKDNNITLLKNNFVSLTDDINLFGLDIEFKYYKKIDTPEFSLEKLQDYIGVLDRNKYNIILAHTPKFFEQYSRIGADLILSGHYHGGGIGIGSNKGLISPQFRLFPRYCRGKFTLNNTDLIVTSGCGSHKVNLRLNNKPEVMVIDLYGHFI